MPRKDQGVPYPFLNPALDPNHPLNRVYEFKEDPYLPLSIRERQRLEREAFEEALSTYTIPHVIRSYETDPERASVYARILGLILPPSQSNESILKDLNPPRDKNGSFSPKRHMKLLDNQDFRQFAYTRLHVAYNRIHASQGDPRWPSDESLVNPDEVCWIMEYSLRECNTTRRQLAYALGLFPAVIDETNPFYDEEMYIQYNEGRRLLCRCRRRNTFCIRPSHIEIFTASKMVLP